MKIANTRKSLKVAQASVLSAAALLGCAAPRPPDPIAMPDDVYHFVRDLARAKVVADECDRYRLNIARIGEERESFENKLKARGVTDAQFNYMIENPDKARLQKDTISFVQRRNIVLGEEATHCAAGDREFRVNSRVARYLEVRS